MLGIRHFRKTAIDLFQGDITEFVCDAMVNAANAQLKGGGGVDGAIHRAGGPSIMAELARYDGCATGDAVITQAGNLPATWVIHAVGPVWNGGQKNEDALLQSAYAKSLSLAVEAQAAHVALPSISTGVYRFPVDRAAGLALTTVKNFLASEEERVLRRVTFVLFDASSYQVFRERLFAIFPEDA